MGKCGKLTYRRLGGNRNQGPASRRGAHIGSGSNAEGRKKCDLEEKGRKLDSQDVKSEGKVTALLGKNFSLKREERGGKRVEKGGKLNRVCGGRGKGVGGGSERGMGGREGVG